MFGRRILSEEEERRLFAEAQLRESLTDKALAARWNIPLRSLQRIIARQRRRYKPVAGNCPSAT